jgi:hypothetical protein
LLRGNVICEAVTAPIHEDDRQTLQVENRRRSNECRLLDVPELIT